MGTGFEVNAGIGKLPEEVLAGELEVGAHLAAGFGGVAGLEGGEDAAVGLEDAGGARGIGVGAEGEFATERGEEGVGDFVEKGMAGGFDDGEVEGDIGGGEAGEVFAIFFHGLEVPADLVERSAALGEEAGAVGLDEDAEVHELDELRSVAAEGGVPGEGFADGALAGFGDVGAAAAAALEHAAGLEGLEGLADDGAADAGFGAEFLFRGEAIARAQEAAADAALQCADDGLCGVFGGGGGTRGHFVKQA